MAFIHIPSRNLSNALRRITNSSARMTFPQFTSLPPEIQTQVWETCVLGPSMHIFDVCFPSWRGSARSVRAFQDSDDKQRFETYQKTVFLDALDTSNRELERPTRVGRHSFDPSMYRFTNSLLSTSRAASSTTSSVKLRDDTNTIFLPGRSQKITIPKSDVLMLRFRDGGAATQTAAQVLFSSESSSISEVLDCEWSPEMAETLRNATKVALDVTETWVPWMHSEAALEEIAYFACTLQKGLEVLYLVDNCAGRCKGCKRDGIIARDLQKRDEVWRKLRQGGEEDEDREGDVIQAVSKRYVEVFDLGSLGWDEEHQSYLFAKRISAAIRDQQHGEDVGKFQGIRVLVMEDEEIEGLETAVQVDCRMKGVIDSPMDLLNESNLHAFSGFLDADTLGMESAEGRVFRMALGWDHEL
ncbi:Fc.00g074480.m01.CDS01 [Cosmosporella sp. VM-42]